MHTLVIIDMQYDFDPDFEIISPILREIELCKRNGYPIVLVEYYNCGHTFSEIEDALVWYHRLQRVLKDQDDGSQEVDNVIGLTTKSKRIRVVGVNTGVCVKLTALSLARDYGYYVDVVEDACADIAGDSEHCRAIKTMQAKKRINIKYNRMANAA